MADALETMQRALAWLTVGFILGFAFAPTAPLPKGIHGKMCEVAHGD